MPKTNPMDACLADARAARQIREAKFVVESVSKKKAISSLKTAIKDVAGYSGTPIGHIDTLESIRAELEDL